MKFLHFCRAETVLLCMVFLSSFLALGFLQDELYEEFDCSHVVSINEKLWDEETTSPCVEKVTDGVINSEWCCCNLQSSLEFVMQLNTSDSSFTCVSILIPTGLHFIDLPVHFGNTSVQFIGLKYGSELPTIHCTYKVDVNVDRLFDLNYVFIDYTLYFEGSESVSIFNLDMLGCQFPIRLDTIARVRIANSSFQ